MTELSKEEILDKEIMPRVRELCTNEEIIIPYATAIKAMQQYADQEKKTEAVRFYEWSQDNGWYKYPNIDRWINVSYKEINGIKFTVRINPHTFDELYSLFKNKQ